MANKDIETIRDFIHGKRDWRSLHSLGLQIEFSSNTCQVSGRGETVFVPTTEDVAIGFVNLLDKPSTMARWASIILAASSVIDLSNLEGEAGDILLEALWDASAGVPLSDKAVIIVRSLAGRKS